MGKVGLFVGYSGIAFAEEEIDEGGNGRYHHHTAYQ
jgi:hypothetical protein